MSDKKKSFKDIINGENPVLLDFHATWCGPCKALAPVIEDVKRKMGDEVQIFKIDVDKNPKLAAALQIRGVPTLMLYKKGEVKWRQSGVVSGAQIMDVIKEHA